MGRPRLTREQQVAGFWRRVEGGDYQECWTWIGSNNGKYGVYAIRQGMWLAHRFAYDLMRAEIPEGLQLDHLCRNTICVNPWHLEPVTASVNLKRSTLGQVNKARGAALTHCTNGHERTDENIYVGPSGSRFCRQCDRDRGAKYRARLKADLSGLDEFTRATS